MTADVAIPCRNCGGELYDSVRKYHLNVPCDNDPCYDFKGGHWSKGSYCPHCDALLTAIDPKTAAAERALLWPVQP